MRKRCGQPGMSLMEVLIALATILILISVMIGVGSYVKTRANIDLTKGMLDVICSALAQYYDNQTPKAFPFDTYRDITADGNPDPYSQDYLLLDLNGVLNVTLTPEEAVSAELFYFLDKDPASRAIVSAVDDSLVTNKDASRADIKIDIGGTIYDLPRYIDPWGVSIRYEYLTGTAFPVLTSAGPDKFFDTPDDVTSK